MSWQHSYNDICMELRILQLHEMEMRKRVELAYEVMVTGEIPSSGPYCHVPLDKAAERYNSAVIDLERVQDEVDRIYAIKLQMEVMIAKLDGLPHVVQHKRMVEGKKYKEIALELGYSVDYLREVVSKAHKKPTQSANVS